MNINTKLRVWAVIVTAVIGFVITTGVMILFLGNEAPPPDDYLLQVFVIFGCVQVPGFSGFEKLERQSGSSWWRLHIVGLFLVTVSFAAYVAVACRDALRYLEVFGPLKFLDYLDHPTLLMAALLVTYLISMIPAVLGAVIVLRAESAIRTAMN